MQTPSASNDCANSINKRRARNRVSQKSFRERQAIYVRQLESQLASHPSDESTRLHAAQKETDKLRRALLATRKRLLGLTTALSGVSENIGVALGLQVDSFRSENQLQEQEQQVNSSKIYAALAEEEDESISSESQTLLSASDTQINQEEQVSQVTSECQQTMFSHVMPLMDVTDGTHIKRALSSSNWHVEDGRPFNLDMSSPSWSLWNSSQAGIYAGMDYHMSNPTINSEPLTNLQRNGLSNGISSTSNQTPGAPLLGEAHITADIRVKFPPGNAAFPSTFSAHLATCEFFIKQNRAYKNRAESGGSDALSKLISNMVNMFVNTAWPDMRVWWAYLQSSSTVEKIMRWRLDPGLESYKALPTCHRPTPTQLTSIHPTIIDWGFFPSIRDRMIELYSYSPHLDQLMCELLGAYVVEADLSNFIIGLDDALPQKGYFRIWDLVQTFSKEDVSENAATSCPYGMSYWQEGAVADRMAVTMGPPSPFQIDEDDDRLDWTPIPLGEVFHSKKAARMLFRLLHMEDRQNVKLDPTFALNHPELCDDPNILASGLDCTVKGAAIDVPLPKALTRETILNYKMMLWKTSVS